MIQEPITIHSCPRCQGATARDSLFNGESEAYCLNCGWRKRNPPPPRLAERQVHQSIDSELLQEIMDTVDVILRDSPAGLTTREITYELEERGYDYPSETVPFSKRIGGWITRFRKQRGYMSSYAGGRGIKVWTLHEDLRQL
jgi:hypothetical protein